MPSVSAAAGELPHALKYKTWVLKVSIHCEGCKKKVKKVLRTVEGVYDINIDTKMHKVTVTGNVEAETLINKLVKSGKNAELWPEPIMKKEKKPKKSKKKEKQSDSKTKTADHQEGHKEPEKEKLVVEEIPKEIAKKIEVDLAQGPKKGENSNSTVKEKANEELDTRAEGKKAEMCGETDPKENGSGGKKKNKGQTSQVEGRPSTNIAPMFSESALLDQADHIPPYNQFYQHQPHYHTLPPVYTMSYNTAQPISSYTASYYPRPPSDSYAYMHRGLEMQPPPSDMDSYSRQPLDSLEMFSDENPNGCYIM